MSSPSSHTRPPAKASTSPTSYPGNYKTVIALLAASGTSPAATYTYDPYGKQLNTLMGVGATNPFQYNSGYQTASGLIHFGARYYDPNIGRWTQLDPSGKNPGYVFAGNNPVNAADPSGTSYTVILSARTEGEASIALLGVLSIASLFLVGPAVPLIVTALIIAGIVSGSTLGILALNNDCLGIKISTFLDVPYNASAFLETCP